MSKTAFPLMGAFMVCQRPHWEKLTAFPMTQALYCPGPGFPIAHSIQILPIGFPLQPPWARLKIDSGQFSLSPMPLGSIEDIPASFALQNLSPAPAQEQFSLASQRKQLAFRPCWLSSFMGRSQIPASWIPLSAGDNIKHSKWYFPIN